MERCPSERRKVQIVEAALGILAKEGARKLTAQHLAAALRLSPGALFRHFPTMDAILDAVLDRAEERLFASFPKAGRDPIEALRAFFIQRVSVIDAHPELSRLLLSGQLEQIGSQAHSERVHGFKRRSQDFVLACLKRAKRKGLLAPALRPETGVVLVVGAVLALAHTSTMVAIAGKRETVAEDTWAALLCALTARPSLPPSATPQRRQGKAPRR